MTKLGCLLLVALTGHVYGYGYYDDYVDGVGGYGSGGYSLDSGYGLLGDGSGAGIGGTGLLLRGSPLLGGGLGYSGGLPYSTEIGGYFPSGLYGGGYGGLGSGYLGTALGSLTGLVGGGGGSRYTDVGERRRARRRLAGAIVGGALGGLLVGSLLGRLGRLGLRGGRGSLGSRLYDGYGGGYGYGRDSYGGYYRRCTRCAYHRRPCYTGRCY
ncbi:uncharacterized protein LOC144150933 [Haemaphysalis longicornis]